VIRALPRGIGSRIAAAAIGVAVLAVTIVAAGTLILGASAFIDLMTADGHPASAARSMFDDSVGRVVLVALLVSIVSAAALSAVLGSRIARPLHEIKRAARRIAAGDYATRVPRDGPEELSSLADSFNQMAASLQEQERLRTEFVANAAHELRTPLTNLQGYLEALRDEVMPADRAAFESLLEEAQRLVRLSRSLDLLGRGDLGAGRPAPVDVDAAEAIRAAVDLVTPALALAGLASSLDVPASLPARADPDGLAQVLGNLLQNALRYTPAGGSVKVTGERRIDDVIVTVSNTGPGIPAADLPHVFERFYRVEKSRDASQGGAGIGLAIVRDIVTAFGGSVGAESADGLTRFWFTLHRP
jgi:signal transduction histidine kinase